MDTNKLKISFLLPNRGLGGGVRAVVRFGNELLLRGHSVRIFHREDGTGIYHKLRNIYHRIRGGHYYDWLWDFKGEVFCYDVLSAELFSSDELIVSMCTKTTFDACTLPIDVGVKVLHCHGVEVENWEKMVDSWQLDIPKIVVSSHLIKLIKKETGHDVLGVAPDGVDTSEYFSSGENARNGIGCSFRWSKEKNPKGTIHAIQALRSRLPDVPIYCYGSSKKPKGLKGVIYTHQPSIAAARLIYSSCKIWFLASISDGFGLPILEAMACGSAVVSSDCGGPSDIIENGINGFIVEVDNTQALVDKIISTYQDDELLTKMQQNALATARKFSWYNGATKLEEYLHEIHRKSVMSKLG